MPPHDDPTRRHYNVTLAVLTFGGHGLRADADLPDPGAAEAPGEPGHQHTWVTWTVTAYLLTGSVATPLIGRLGDQHGKARLMVIALAVFLVGSVGAIFAWNVGALIVFRAIQGVGGAVFPPQLRDHPRRVPARAPERRRWAWCRRCSASAAAWASCRAAWSSTTSRGAGCSWSARSWSRRPWSWCGASCPSRRVRAPSSVDVWGALPSRAAWSACSWSRSPRGTTSAGRSPAVLGLFGGAAAFLVAWVLVELRVKDPMVDMRMMARRVVLFTNVTAMLAGFALYMTWVILPAFYQLPSDLPPQLAAPGGLRLRHQRDRRRALDAADLVLAAGGGPAGRALRRPPRPAGAAGGRDAAGGGRLGGHRGLPRRALAAGDLVHPRSASGSASPSPPCPS